MSAAAAAASRPGAAPGAARAGQMPLPVPVPCQLLAVLDGWHAGSGLRTGRAADGRVLRLPARLALAPVRVERRPVTRNPFASSVSVEWVTPAAVFAQLDAEFGPFDLDPCATAENAKASRFYTAEDDWLSQPWKGRVFMNSPRPAGAAPRPESPPSHRRPAQRKGPGCYPGAPRLFSAGSAITSERICCLLEIKVPGPGRGAGGHGLAEGATVVAHSQE